MVVGGSRWTWHSPSSLHPHSCSQSKANFIDWRSHIGMSQFWVLCQLAGGPAFLAGIAPGSFKKFGAASEKTSVSLGMFFDKIYNLDAWNVVPRVLLVDYSFRTRAAKAIKCLACGHRSEETFCQSFR